jgi:hypothetical protein
LSGSLLRGLALTDVDFCLFATKVELDIEESLWWGEFLALKHRWRIEFFGLYLMVVLSCWDMGLQLFEIVGKLIG